MGSRLPIPVRPAADELAVSYLNRLAALHAMPFDELWAQVARPRRAHGKTLALDGDQLAEVSGQPRARLNRAIIELRGRGTDWWALRHEPQRGCHRCDARHPGGPVLHLLGHHHYVCTRHSVWIGPPDQIDHPQPDLTELPEIVAAQHKHLRLLRRIGPAATYDALLTGFLICAHRWNHTDFTLDGDAWLRWHARADLLIPHGTETDTFSTSRLFAATYPEAVTVAELIGPLRWRRLAAGAPEQQRAFTAELGRRLGLRDYRPTVTKDALAHWIEADCWQPPSLPGSNYRRLRTFAGKNFPRTGMGKEDSRRETAYWFLRKHRCGGDPMLHHRTLQPVIIRDWSPDMDIFTGALHASSTISTKHRQHITSDGTASEPDTEFIRPDPAPDDYLSTATEPVPWVEPPSPRRARIQPRRHREPGGKRAFP